MKTLVIHIQDETTDFLYKVYANNNWDMIDHSNYSSDELKEVIDMYDRVVMLGHGSPDGLFGDYGFIIDESFGPLLASKETVCIWCNADQYVQRHGLTGFYTGMFISEVQEAEWMNIYDSTNKSVEFSNNKFVELLSEHIFTDGILDKIKDAYKVDNDSVVAYNNRRLYFE